MTILQWHLTTRAKAYMQLTSCTRFDLLGYLDSSISDSWPTAVQALDASYQHGGGWRPFGGDKWRLVTPTSSPDHTASLDEGDVRLTYPGDPPMPCIAYTRYEPTAERIYLFDSAWVVVTDADGNLTSVARMD